MSTSMLSIQLYTLRSLGDVDRVLDTVKAVGYAHVETVGSHLDQADAVKAKLDARGLTVSSSHVGLPAMRERPDQVAAAARTLGFQQLYVPAVPPAERDSPAPYWRALGRELGELARRFQDQGLKLGWHNHAFEFKPKDGPLTAMELLLAEAEGSPLSWQMDVAWVVRGGADPKAWLTRYAGRISAAHVKDIAPAGQNEDQDGWADVGSGVLDWRDLWAACKAAGATWMVVEHDNPKDPAATARNSFDFLKTIA